MPKRKDTATFVAQARAIHGEKYDYSRVQYLRCRKPVEIVCPLHGSFWQTPDLHRKGRNCRKCSALKRTDSPDARCRICGCRVTYHDRTRKLCQSEACKTLHKTEKQKAGWLKKRWGRERTRQRGFARTEIEKRCARAYHSVWMAKRYRTKAADNSARPVKPITEKMLKERQRQKRRWDSLTAIEKKAVGFCRETNSGRRWMANRKGSVRMRELLKKLEQQGNRCALSGELIDHKNSEIDHIIPVSRGGSSEIENLQWVTRKINRMKQTMTNEEFVDACKAVIEHTLRPSPPSLLGPS